VLRCHVTDVAPQARWLHGARNSIVVGTLIVAIPPRKTPKAPEILQVPVAELDTSQLPADARQPGTDAFEKIIKQFPQHPVSDAAIAGANRMADVDLHETVGGKPRMDAVMYMQGAMDTFASLPREKVGEIVMEIARLGQSGLAINDREHRYSLKSLPGDYSGLHLMCLMHVGFLMFDSNTDPGTGLQREYDLAVSMRGPSA
jgi:hypothetical protein